MNVQNEMICPICGNMGHKCFENIIMKKYNVAYFLCDKCGGVYTEKPYWLEEAYSDALSSMDTGVMSRNILLSQNVDDLLTALIKLDSTIANGEFVGLDYAGGYGIMTRMLRDLGYDFRWYDKYAINDVAKGYEYKTGNVDVITAFEVFEHFDNPIYEIEWMIERDPKAIIFSTELNSTGSYPDKEWWYYCFEHGQHVLFWSARALEFTANKYGYQYASISNNLHVFIKPELNVNGVKKLYKVKQRKRTIAQKISMMLGIYKKRKSLTQMDFDEQRSILNNKNIVT